MADEELRKLFASNLTHYLQLNGYNQADLARHMHVSTATTAKWCTGQTMPRIDKIQSICNWLGIDKSSLLDYDPVQTDVHPSSYYIDAETRQLAQELHDNPELSVMLDAYKTLSPRDAKLVMEMVRRMQNEGTD